MRLREPSIRHLESEDRSCSLTYEGPDPAPAQAAGGAMYLLRVRGPEGVTELRGTVQATTDTRAERQAEAEGLDPEAMNLTELREYSEAFAETHGRSSSVILLLYADETKGGPTRKILNEEAVSEKFCKMYLRLQASFEFNNSEYPACGQGYYPDTVTYDPWDVDPALIRRFAAAEEFNAQFASLLPETGAPGRAPAGMEATCE